MKKTFLISLLLIAIFSKIAAQSPTNLLNNGGFEDGYTSWLSNSVNGSSTNFSTISSGTYSGSKSACAKINALGKNFWDINLIHLPTQYTGGLTYTIKFWAKADVIDQELTLAISEVDTYLSIGTQGQTYKLTTEWKEYKHSFIANRNTNAYISLNISYLTNVGRNICFDEVSLYIESTEPILDADDDPRTSSPASAKTWKRANEMGFGITLEVYNGDPKNPDIRENNSNYVPYTKNDIANLAKMNIKTVRCATGIEYMMRRTSPYDLDLTHPGYKILDSLIEWTNAYKIRLIIDNHLGLEYDKSEIYWRNTTFAQNDLQRITTLWKQLAVRYKKYSADLLFFEIKNEPGIAEQDIVNSNNLRKINNSVIDAVREIDKDRTLIVTAIGYSTIDLLVKTRAYNDDNLIYTFHNYDPYDFTYQGFTWFAAAPPIDRAFPLGARSDMAIMRQQYKTVKNWSNKYKVPVTNGEFGVSGRADPDSRCRYIKNSCAIMDSLGIPANYFSQHSYYYGFGFFKDGMLEASKAITCFMDALRFTKPTEIPPTSKILYKGGKTEIVGTWVKEGSATIAETNNDSPFEGGQHYKFDYKSTTGYNSGVLNFHNWWGYTKPPLDFTDGNYTHLRLSYKGLTSGQKLMGQLMYRYLRRDNDGVLREQTKAGTLVEIGTYSAAYKTTDIPLESLKGSDLKGLWFVSAISFFLSDLTMSGTVYIDGIELINKNVSLCIAPTNISTSSITTTSAMLSWSNVVGARDYKVEYKANNTNTWMVLPNTTATTATLKELTAGTLYNVRVTSNCPSNTSTPSETISFTTNTNTNSNFPAGLPVCLQDDFTELKKLYDATNGASWANKTNWITNPDLSTWKGITLTDDKCDVKTISLEGNNLTGILPSLTLPKLTQLLVYTNQITGTIPNMNLPELTTFWLSFNALSGNIPDFNMPKLNSFRARSCQFSGKLPDFSNTSLTTNGALWISGNKFIFGDLEGKTWLSVSDLIYAPQQVVKLTQNGNTISMNTGVADNMQSFDWYKDGQLAVANQSSSYTPTANGKYSCRAKHNTLTIISTDGKNLILQSDTLNYIITNPNPNTSTTLKIADAQSAKGAMVNIPVTISKSVMDIKGFQFFFKIDNPNVASFLDIQPSKLTNPPFSYKIDKTKISAGEIAIIGFSLGDVVSLNVNDELFTISLRVDGSVGQQSAITFINDNKFALKDGNNVALTLQAGSIKVSNNVFKISGNAIHPIAKKAIGNVKFSILQNNQAVISSETDASGNYTMDATNVTNIVVKPTKTGIASGKIDIDDISAMVDIIFNVNQNAYQRIAADWNCDNKIDISDISDVIDYIFTKKLANKCTNDWYFIPNTTQLNGSYPYTYNSEIMINNLNSNQVLNYSGVMRGDVNGNVLFQNEEVATRNLAKSIELYAMNQGVESGKSYKIPVRVRNFDGIKNFQGVLNYDKSLLELQSVSTKSTLAKQIFKVSTDSIGKIALLWANFGEGGITLADKDTMITLSFLAKKTTQSLKNVLNLNTSNDAFLPSKATDALGNVLNMSFSVDMLSAASDGLENITEFAIFPNPSNNRLNISAQFAKTTEVELIITNIVGQIMAKNSFQTAHLQEYLDVSSYPEGIYTISLQTANGKVSRKVVVMR